VGSYFRSASPLGAPDPDGWRGREHISPFFLNDDTEAQERIIKHLIVPYAKGEFLQSDLHECAGGRGRMSLLFTFPSSYSRVGTPRIVSFVQSCRFGDWNMFLKSSWQMIFGSSLSCAKSWIMLTSLAQTIAPSIDPAFWIKFGIVSVKYAHASSLTCALMRCASHRRHWLGLLMGRGGCS